MPNKLNIAVLSQEAHFPGELEKILTKTSQQQVWEIQKLKPGASLEDVQRTQPSAVILDESLFLNFPEREKLTALYPVIVVHCKPSESVCAALMEAGVRDIWPDLKSQKERVIYSLLLAAGSKTGGRGSSVLNRVENELWVTEEKYRTVFENSAAAITVTDAHEKIVSWNKFAEDLLGMTASDLHQTPIQKLYPPEEWKKIQSMELRKQGMIHHLETKMIRRDGSLMDVDVSVTILTTPDGGKTGSIGIFRDITERKQAELISKKLTSAIEETGDSIVITDVQGTIEYVNPAFTRKTGYTREEALGKNPRILKSHKHDVSFYRTLWDCILSGKTYRGTFINKKKNGEFYHEEQVITPVKDGQGKITHFVSTSRDISAQVEAERALQRAKDEAENANRVKGDFLAHMSHEIRTPMNGIIGMANLLMETNLTPDQAEYVRGVRNSGESLLILINDILDFSKIEAGRLSIDPIPFDLGVAVEEVTDLLAIKAEEKKIELIVRYDPKAPRRLVGDAGRIRQILTNLIGNAVKFTDKGYVFLDVSCKEVKDQKAHFYISVEDTGMGIVKEKQAVIFEKFSQADSSKGGTGLGLTICKELTQLMGGELGVESELGKGSKFWFELWLPVDAKAPKPVTKTDLAGLKLLIVEDDEISRRVLKEQVASLGISPETASSGEDALKQLKAAQGDNRPFDIMITDNMMPGMDAEALASAIRSDASIKAPLMILLTAIGKRGDAKKFMAMGFCGYLLKPIKQPQLLDLLASVWSMKQKGEKIDFFTRHSLREMKAGGTPAGSGQPGGLSFQVLLAEDNVVNQRVAQVMLEKIGCRVDLAFNGKEAVEKSSGKKYDMIFMDCQMPIMDGYEATRRIRQDQSNQCANIPVVAITANAMEGERDKCLESGMNDYIRKPISVNDLTQVLEKYCGLKSSQPETSSATAAGGSSSSAGESSKGIGKPVINRERIATLIEFTSDGDQGFLKEIFETYFKSAETKIQTLKESADIKDAEKLRKEAHTLKGSSANLGAERVADLCLEMEMMGKNGNPEQAAPFIEKLIAELEQVKKEYAAIIAVKS